MLKTELKLPFIFYNALAKQHRFRSDISYKLVCGNSALLPFQIKKEIGGTITEFALYFLDNTIAYNFTAQSSTIEVVHTTDFEWMIYKGDALPTIPAGCYYCKITKGSTWYSEIFIVKDDLSEYPVLEWSNSCDIDPVIYQTGYVNRIYINGKPGLPGYLEALQPELTEEGEENGVSDFIPTFQKVVYKHKAEFFAPDYLFDALAFAQINDTIAVSEKGDTSEVQRFKATANYGDDGFFGSGKIEFEFPGRYEKGSCCDNLDLTDGGGGGGGGDTCDITISNIIQTDIGEGVTQIDFTPVLNGATVDHYQWRSTDYASNAWQDIGTSTTFTHTFSAGSSITVEIQAICDNAVAGTTGSITFGTDSGVSYTSAFTFDINSGSVPSFIIAFTTAGLHYKVVWDNSAPAIFDEVVCTNAHTGYSSPTHTYTGSATGTVYFETGAVVEEIQAIEGSAGFTAISNLGGFTSLATFNCANQSLTTLPTLPDSILHFNCTQNMIGSFDISALLIQLDGAGNTGGQFQSDAQSPSAPPSGPGNTAKTNLISKGWTVTTD